MRFIWYDAMVGFMAAAIFRRPQMRPTRKSPYDCSTGLTPAPIAALESSPKAC
jgi:hypothetical protein